MTNQPEEQLAVVPSEPAEVLSYGNDDTSVVKIYNKELDAYSQAPRGGVQFLQGWEIVDPSPAEAQQATSFDPSAHSVSEVNDYLASATDGERQNVLVLERDGKNRSTILSRWEGEAPEQQ